MDSYKKEVLESLEQHHGIVTTACASIGCPRSTYYNWLSSDAEFKLAVEDIQETAIDFVESKLMELITFRDTTAVIFFLKTRGKKRGYVERMEVDDVTPIRLLTNNPLNDTTADEDNKSVDN
jgi:hypothetical protein